MNLLAAGVQEEFGDVFRSDAGGGENFDAAARCTHECGDACASCVCGRGRAAGEDAREAEVDQLSEAAELIREEVEGAVEDGAALRESDQFGAANAVDGAVGSEDAEDDRGRAVAEEPFGIALHRCGFALGVSEAAAAGSEQNADGRVGERVAENEERAG